MTVMWPVEHVHNGGAAVGHLEMLPGKVTELFEERNNRLANDISDLCTIKKIIN
jgi:hypothetical protein